MKKGQQIYFIGRTVISGIRLISLTGFLSPQKKPVRIQMTPPELGPSKLLSLMFIIVLILFLSSCAREERTEQPFVWPSEEVQKEDKPVLPPPTRISEEIYVDITARAALIFDKYKEDLDEAHRQMDLVYQKYGITLPEYDRFRKNLTLDKKRQLEKQVQERIQVIYKEYFPEYDTSGLNRFNDFSGAAGKKEVVESAFP